MENYNPSINNSQLTLIAGSDTDLRGQGVENPSMENDVPADPRRESCLDCSRKGKFSFFKLRCN